MAVDSLFSAVGLLLHGDGVDSGTSIIDSSPSPKTPTVTSVTTSTAQSKFGGASLRFGTGGSRLSYPHAAALQPTDDFCIEAFVRVPSTTGALRIICWKSLTTGAHPYRLSITSDGAVYASACDAATTQVSLASADTLAANVFHHIALDRLGSALRLIVNGALVASGTLSGASYSNASHPLVIGGTSDGAYGLGGGGAAYIDEFRITLASRYSSEFTTPTEAFPNASSAYALSGTVTGSTGSPVSRAIRAQREDTGAYVGGTISNATTGAYTIPTLYSGEHTVVAYPVTGENLPALVHHGVIPI